MDSTEKHLKSVMRLAVVVPEVRVADLAFNCAQIHRSLDLLRENQPDWIIFPRLCLTGASCGDLFRQKLLQESAREALSALIPLTSGTSSKMLLGLPLAFGEEVFEGLAQIRYGKIEALMAALTPESPSLSSASSLPKGAKLQIADKQIEVIASNSIRINGAEINLGYQIPPSEDSGLLINLVNLPAIAPAEGLLQTGFNPASRPGVVVICSAGASESTTDQVYSGRAEIWQNGKRLAAAPELSFETQIVQAECALEVFTPARTPENKPIRSLSVRFPFISRTQPEKQFERLLEIQSAGLIRRLLHTRQRKVVLGLSGGADSSQALLVCCRAFDRLGLEREGILAVWMPGPGSSQSSQQRSASLADLAGVAQRTIPIGEAVLSHLEDIGHPAGLHDVTFENAQARERTQILMDLANQQNALVVGTGDLSEIALGWSTFNGDHMSMYNVNCGLPKTLLLRLLVWAGGFLFGKEGEKLARKIAEAPVSPELLPVDAAGETPQKTEETLGPYELHDFFLFYAIYKQLPPKEVFLEARRCFRGDYAPGEILTTLKTFYRRFFSQQFKRSASPDGPQLLEISLSPRSGWRMPSDVSAALWLDAVEKIDASESHS